MKNSLQKYSNKPTLNSEIRFLIQRLRKRMSKPPSDRCPCPACKQEREKLH